MFPVPARPQAEQEFGGIWWRLRQPPISQATRIYDGLVGAFGGAVVQRCVKEVMRRDPTTAGAVAEAESQEASEWAASAALLVLRRAHLGGIVSRLEITGCLAALAPLLVGADAERIDYWSRELLWASRLQAAPNAQKIYTGSQNPLAVAIQQENRDAFFAAYDSICPDVQTDKLLKFWAFLMLVRPSRAVSSTAR